MDELLRSILPKISVFGGLSDAALAKISSLMEKLHFEEQELIGKEDEIAHSLFVIAKGKCSITASLGTGRSPYPIAEVGPGDCVGEMSLIDMQTRGADITALTDVTVYSLKNSDFMTIYAWDPETYTIMLSNIARELSRRLRVANSKIIRRAKRLDID
jgi:CRP-like cAMP-binding protein